MAERLKRQHDFVVAHDYLTQRGGAERVALELTKAFQPGELATALYSPSATFQNFAEYKVQPSWLNKFPIFRKDPRRAFPLLASAWSMRDQTNAKVAICSSSGWSHGLRVTPTTRKIIYCHNPPRWLHQQNDYLMDQGRLAKAAVSTLRNSLVQWDLKAARSADVYIANSTSVARRIKEAYGRDAIVIFPPVSVDTKGRTAGFSYLETRPFFLTVARPRGYKGTQTLIDAFEQMPEKDLVVVGGFRSGDCPPNVHLLGIVSEEQLRWLYRHAAALTSISKEDFGLTPIEANSFGTPTLVVRDGGFLDSTDEGVSGSFIETPSVAGIIKATKEFRVQWDRPGIERHAAKFGVDQFIRRISAVVDDVLADRIR